MMSYLYPEDEVTFDKSGFGPLPDMLGSYSEEEANSYFELYFEYPLFSSHERGDYNQIYVNMSDYLIEGNQVTYKPSHSREPHAFRIYKTEKQVERGIILVWARTRTADLRGNPVRKVKSNGAPVSSALKALKMASEETHPFSFTTNIQSNISFEKTQTNVLDALAGEEDSILAITGGQMIRTNNDIYIGINESSKNIVEFRLGKNIEGMSYEVDYSNVVTAVIPFYTQTYKLVDDIRDEIVRDSKGKIVKNTDGTTKYNRTVGKKRESLDKEIIVYGDTVFSQYANDYSTPFYSFVEIRDDREDPGADKDPLPPFTKADINNRAVEWFNWEENLGVDEPEVSVKVDVHDISQSSEYSHNINLSKLETLNVFDKALVYVPEVGIDMDMEINYIRYDGVAEKNLEVRLGTTLTSLTETVLSPQQRAFNERVQQLDREIEKSLMSSDGKSRVYWMATKPIGQFEIGDLWFDISLDGGIYVWDGYDWVAKLPPEFGKLIEDSVNEAIEAADLAMQEAKTASDKALADAKAYAVEQDKLITQQVTTSVNTAISTAEAAKTAAKTNADKALADAKAHAIAQDKLITQQVNTSVGTALSTAQAAKTAAESSYTNAVAEAERLVGVQTTAFNKKFEENATAMGTLSQAAKDADTKAQSALTKAGTNANTLTTHQNTLNTINTTTIPAVNKAAADAMAEAKKADTKIASYVTSKGLVSGTTVDTKINTATGAITATLNELQADKLDSSTYTTFYTNEYKKTAQGVTDIYTKVNKIMDANGNTLDTFAKAVYDKNATRQSAAFTAVTKNLVTTTTYTAGIDGITTRLNAIDSSDPKSLVTRYNKTESTVIGNTTTIGAIKTKPGEQITGYQTIKNRSDLYERVIGSSSEAGVKQAMSRIVMTDSTFQTEVIDKQNLLTAMASGSGMTPDPYFEKGTNGLGVYDNGGTGTITVKRTAIPSTTSIPAPKGNGGYRLDITHAASSATTPNRGGVVRTVNSWANGTVVVKFVALLPTGRSFAQANNPLGTGYTTGWLTDSKGTGKWETYMYYYRFGSTGSFSSFGHISVTGASTAFTWFLSEYDIINVNDTVASKVTQLSDSWSMKLKKADDVVTQINATSAGVLIQGKNIQLDGNVSMTSTFSVPNANIKDLAVNKITGTNAQFTTMITKGLTADVITSTMIKADAGLFDMLFSSTLATTRLAAQNAWITNAAIASLDAGKITTGTIAAARINASAVVTAGLTANVIKSTHIESGTGLIDKIFATDALVTHLTSKTIFATNVKAITIDASKITSGTIAAGRINAALVVSSGLVSNVVKSTHIEAGTALVDKIFASSAYITRLTSKTAFISSIQAISINASKITSGTLDASKVTVTNIDASKITANKTTFVQSAWNALNSTISIDGNGIRSANAGGDWTLYHSGAVSFGNSASQGVYLEYSDGARNGLAINNRGALNTDITLDLMSSARNTINFGRRTDTNGYDFRIDHYQGHKVSFDGRGVQRYTFNVNGDAQSHAISILGHGATSGYNRGSGISIGMETADGSSKGSRFYFSSTSDLVWLSKNSFSDLKPLAVFDLQFRWGENGRKSMKTVLEYLSRATGVNINNIPDV